MEQAKAAKAQESNPPKVTEEVAKVEDRTPIAYKILETMKITTANGRTRVSEGKIVSATSLGYLELLRNQKVPMEAIYDTSINS